MFSFDLLSSLLMSHGSGGRLNFADGKFSRKQVTRKRLLIYSLHKGPNDSTREIMSLLPLTTHTLAAHRS